MDDPYAPDPDPEADPDPDPAADIAPAPGTLPNAIPLRARHDGWTPQRQHDFIAALAETGCVTEAAATVKVTPRSAYRLRARPDANIFRQAWDIALDYAIRNLTDAALARSINGVARPVFYKGEQIGERRYYNERLTQFLLRYRDPARYGAWLDGYEARRHPDGAGIILANALNIVFDAAHGFDPPVDGEGIERPLGEGPVPESQMAIDEEAFDAKFAHMSPEAREMKKVLDNAFRKQAAADADDEARDWRDPLTALRPVGASKFKGA